MASSSAIKRKKLEKQNKVSGNEGGTKNNWGMFFKDALVNILQYLVWFLLGSSVLNSIVLNEQFTDFSSSRYPSSINVSCSLSDWFKNVWKTSWGNTQLTMKNILSIFNSGIDLIKSKVQMLPYTTPDKSSWYIEAAYLLFGPFLIFGAWFIGLFTGYFYTVEASWCFSDYLFKFFGVMAGVFFLGPFFSMAQSFGLVLKLMFFIFTVKNTSGMINTFKRFKGLLFTLALLAIIMSMSVNLKPIFLYVTIGLIILFTILDFIFPIRKKKPNINIPIANKA